MKFNQCINSCLSIVQYSILIIRANESMYHALGYGTIMFLQAVMTFDKVRPCNLVHFNFTHYMTIFASGPEHEIQQFDWFLSGMELAVPDR